MGDRVAVLKDGVLQQVDKPLALYERPANLFVAGFIGSPGMNLMTTSVSVGGVRLGDQVIPVPRDVLAKATDARVIVGVRPENLQLAPDGAGLSMIVNQVEDLGSVSFVYGSVDLDGVTADLVVRTVSRCGLVAGQTVAITADPAAMVLFDPDTGRRLAE